MTISSERFTLLKALMIVCRDFGLCLGTRDQKTSHMTTTGGLSPLSPLRGYAPRIPFHFLELIGGIEKNGNELE